MKVLVVGGGGREHAIAWKLRQNSRLSQLYIAPGNAGTAQLGQNVNIQATAVEELVNFAVKEGIELVVVGPEDALVSGLVDAMAAHGISAFGPGREAAMLEGSKVWAKTLMREFGIPTAPFEIYTDVEAARAHCKAAAYPLVIKADGLAKGKGAFVCESQAEALDVLDKVMVRRELGQAGASIVIEECLEGQEASVMFFTDGKSLSLLPTTQDHKRIFDGDRGPNTGGMGAYSPVPIMSPELERRCLDEIAYPLIKALATRHVTYHGVVCSNLMLTPTGPQVLEFNARFGDPEIEVALPLLQTDLLDIIEAILAEKLDQLDIKCSSQAAMCVAIASQGYPDTSKVGDPISGLGDHIENTLTFHAGTSQRDGQVITAGGRVLIITGLGATLADARETAYQRVRQIHFDGMQYRQDIGWRALSSNVRG